MNKLIFAFFLIPLVWFQNSKAQDFSSLWKAHFAYYNVTDVVNGDNSIYAAAENAIFRYDFTNQGIETITTVQGLSGQEISALYYSQEFQSLIIGYGNGLLEVYSEIDNSVLTIVDILDRQNIPPTDKGINNFYENDGLIYISTDFGVSVYNLERLEFGDTYFLGDGGAQISVQQVSVLNNKLYVACLDNNGIKRADLNNPNLIDFNEWETVVTGNFFSASNLNNKIYAVASNNNVIELDGNTNTVSFSLPFRPLDVKSSNDNLVFTSSNSSLVYDVNLSIIANFVPTSDFQTNFTSAIFLNNVAYIGTQNFGVLQSSSSNPSEYVEIRPDGPLENSIFKLNASGGNIWATYGEYSSTLNPFPLTSKGISILVNDSWRNTPFDSLLGTRELNEIVFNPFNPNQVFISSYKDGILEFNNFEPTFLFNQTNSGLESLILPGNPSFVGIRVSGLQFDTQGLLWSVTSRVDRALKSYDPTTSNWSGYSFSSLISDPLNDDLGFFDLVIDNNGTKWTGSFYSRLIAYNENLSDPIKNITTANDGVDPFMRFRALAIDNNNQLWIGTNFGLRVLANTSGFFEDPNPALDIIVIIEDGLPQELLNGEAINDIKVDGANNKWVGTSDSGAFYFSENGQETLFHFTEDNSPLPSNNIRDITVDSENGVVYFATDRGLLSFNSGGSEPSENLSNTFVYPNPVRPEYGILGFSDLNDITKGVKIMGLTERVNIKITDIEGNLVAEAQSRINPRTVTDTNFGIDGGTAVWNGKNLAGNIVRSGVYLILISDLVSFETKVLKVLIVR